MGSCQVIVQFERIIMRDKVMGSTFLEWARVVSDG
jgi:hypothetical protein